MRQIKFRGVFKVRDNDYYSEDEKNYIESKQHEILSISIGSHCTIAYQDTVMTVFEMHCSNYDILQFTGLVDRNGKEIYENDIVKVHIENADFITVVTWGKNSRGWKLKCDRTKIDRWGTIKYYSLPSSDRIEIIDNIFDNPELLNEKQ